MAAKKDPRDEALDAIHDEALRLLQNDLPDDVEEGLELIVSLARYKIDVRSSDETQNSEAPEKQPSRLPKTRAVDLSRKSNDIGDRVGYTRGTDELQRRFKP